MQRRARLLILLSSLAGCAAATERAYVAPTQETVTARLEAAYDGRGQHIMVQNFSSVEITITSLNLNSCENIKNRCDVTRLRIPVKPGMTHRLATVEPADLGRQSNFRYSWTWEQSGAVPDEL